MFYSSFYTATWLLQTTVMRPAIIAIKPFKVQTLNAVVFASKQHTSKPANDL